MREQRPPEKKGQSVISLADRAVAFRCATQKIDTIFHPRSEARPENAADRLKTSRCESRDLEATGQLENCPNTLRNPRPRPAVGSFSTKGDGFGEGSGFLTRRIFYLHPRELQIFQATFDYTQRQLPPLQISFSLALTISVHFPPFHLTSFLNPPLSSSL